MMMSPTSGLIVPTKFGSRSMKPLQNLNDHLSQRQLQTLPSQDNASISIRRAYLLSKILRNSVQDVQATLEENRNNLLFNFSIGHQSADGQGKISEPCYSIDDVFAIKMVLGESPTALHVAVLNLYYRCVGGKFPTLPFLLPKRQKEIENARKILNLLLLSQEKYVRHSSPVLFVNTWGSDGKFTLMSPATRNIHALVLAKQLSNMTTNLKSRKIQAVIDSTVEYMEQILAESRPNNHIEDSLSEIDKPVTFAMNDGKKSKVAPIATTDEENSIKISPQKTQTVSKIAIPLISRHALERTMQVLFSGGDGKSSDVTITTHQIAKSQSIVTPCAHGIALYCWDNNDIGLFGDSCEQET